MARLRVAAETHAPARPRRGKGRRTMSGSITLAVPPPAGTEASEPPSGAHRGLALVAAISLAIGTRSAWTIALTADPVVMLGLSASYLVVLGSAVLAVTVRTRRGLIVVEALILATGAAMVLAMLALHHRPSDEGAIVVQAARSWLDGGEVYGVPWPSLFSSEHMPVTRLMDG